MEIINYVLLTVLYYPPQAAINVPNPGTMMLSAAQKKASGLDIRGTEVAKLHTYLSISSKTKTFVLKKLTDLSCKFS